MGQGGVGLQYAARGMEGNYIRTVDSGLVVSLADCLS